MEDGIKILAAAKKNLNPRNGVLQTAAPTSFSLEWVPRSPILRPCGMIVGFPSALAPLSLMKKITVLWNRSFCFR